MIKHGKTCRIHLGGKFFLFDSRKACQNDLDGHVQHYLTQSGRRGQSPFLDPATAATAAPAVSAEASSTE